MAYVGMDVAAQGTNATIWINWNQTQTTAASTLTQQIWAGWQYMGTAGTLIPMHVSAYSGPNLLDTESEEQRAEREAANERMRVRREAENQRQSEARAKMAAEREAAKLRALEVLAFCLTPEQMVSYRENGWFEVRGSKGGRYRIRASGQAGNVDLMPEIGEVRDKSYCCHPPGGLPDPDAHLAQMLALVTDEEQFLKVANVSYNSPASSRGLRAAA